MNVYDWTITLTNCDVNGEASGVATLTESSSGAGDLNWLFMIGNLDNFPWVMGATK
jgi:hypothetical protein